MERIVEDFAGDTPGVTWRLPVLQFRPKAGADAPRVYIQAGLHANELPGVGAAHLLAGLLEAAEAEGRLRGAVTLVPYANPIGLNQEIFGRMSGRFDAGTRTNFNRDFPLPGDAPRPLASQAVNRLKRHLLSLASPADIVLDLHCDDVSMPYLYVYRPMWPGLQDLAAALACDAVLLWDLPGDNSFEDAALAPMLSLPPEELAGKAVSTVELRGLTDVSRQFASQDARGLMRFLAGRGVVEGMAPPLSQWAGLTVPLQQIEMVRAPVGGAVWFDVAPGQRVGKGERLATILHAPGDHEGTTDVLAPADGTVLTRVSEPVTRPGYDLLKLATEGHSSTYRPGALEV